MPLPHISGEVSHAPLMHDWMVAFHVVLNCIKNSLMPVRNNAHLTVLSNNISMDQMQKPWPAIVVSPSTKENASGVKRSSPCMLVAINNAPRYFPVRNAPSTLITGLQCLNASTYCGMYQYARFITGFMEPLCISCLPVVWVHHFVPRLKCAIALNIFGILP